MRVRILKQLLATLMVSVPLVAVAEAPSEGGSSALKQKLARLLPQYTPDEITKSEVAGLYAVRFGTQVVYVSGDGRYLIQGKMLDLETKQDLTEPKVSGARAAMIKQQVAEEMITYPAKESSHTVTVFTDIDCPYCRKFHREIPDYNKLGITVRYLFFPRAGVGSESYNKSVSVWCAEDRNAAMDLAKAGDEPEAKQCDNPVQAQKALGEQLGVRGTPTIFLEDGTILPGYVEAAQLRAMIDR